MKKEIEFYKMHGAGNDFVCINNKNGKTKLTKKEIIFLCDRHFGVGADGVILMEKKGKDNDIFMNYWNSDGTFAEMCGNGARCTAHFAKEIWKNKKDIIKVNTRSGVKEVKVFKNDLFEVNMGLPLEEKKDFPSEDKKIENLDWTFVSMGNPHAVTFLENEDEILINNIGPKIEKNKNFFPNDINVNFVIKNKDKEFKVITWERGAGRTMACGTGSSGSYSKICEKYNFKNSEKIKINVPGGVLYFKKNKKGEILMKGPSKFVFNGKIIL